MGTRPRLIAALLGGTLFLLPETSWAEAICDKQRPLKPVHCVCGKLIDQSGAAVSGALVSVSREGAELATMNTQADGKFEFRDLKSDKYELAADFDGFQQFRSPIVLTKPAKECRHELVIVMVLTYPDNCGSYVMKH
jgi:hypothetical protein